MSTDKKQKILNDSLAAIGVSDVVRSDFQKYISKQSYVHMPNGIKIV